MKTKKPTNQLMLNKKTVANLNKNELKRLKGGLIASKGSCPGCVDTSD